MIKKSNLQPTSPSIPNWRLMLYPLILIGGCALVGYFTNENPWKFAGIGAASLVAMLVIVTALLLALNNPKTEKIIHKLLWLYKWFLVVFLPYSLYLIISTAIEKAF